jgi:hypothetical protein
MHRSLALSCLLFAACGGGAASTQTEHGSSGPTYAIHLTRHTTVGFAWSETAHFTQLQQTIVHDAQGAVVSDQTQGTAIELTGDYTVLTVSPSGDPAQMRLVLRAFTVDAGTGAVTPSVPGNALLIDRTNDTITGAAGEPLDAALVAALRSVVPDRAPPVDDDLVFGTREPQAVGASWPIDSEGAARGLAALQLTVAPADVGGSSTLVDAGNEGGHDVLELRTVISAHHVGMPGLPQGSVERRADVLAGIEMVLPVDVSLPPLRELERAAIDIEVTVPTPGGDQTVDVSIRQEATHERTLH